MVVKADGLAAGKGVTVAGTRAEAEAAVRGIFSGRFGTAGAEAVIEEFLEGEEVSLFAITDGSTIVPFGSAQDHKRVGEGDTGPNTGGMGAYSPAPVLTPMLEGEALATIVAPTVRAMADAGTAYSGVLYAGLMLTATGPRLIEYNCRFGDPECQVLMMRLEDDLWRTAVRLRRKPPRRDRPAAVPARDRADRGDRGEGLSPNPGQRRADRRARRRRSGWRQSVPRGHRARSGRNAGRQRRAGAGRHRARRFGSRSPGRRLSRARRDRFRRRLLPP